MKKLLILTSFIQLSVSLLGGSPPINIQAKCEITKVDGTIVEGYMLIGIFECEEEWMNGFISYQHKHFSTTDTIYNIKEINFTRGFKSIEFDDGLINVTYKTFFNISPRQSGLLYVIWKSKPSVYKIKKSDLKSYNFPINEDDYELSDSVIVFHDLDKNSNISPNSENKTIIAIKDILVLKFLEVNETSNISEINQKGIKTNEKSNIPEMF